MRKTLRIVLIVIGLMLLGAAGVGIYYLNGAMPIGTGHTAKYVCSKVFLSGQDAVKVYEIELKPANPLFRLVRTRVDYEQKTVTSTGLGFWKPATALFRQGVGCTLTTETTRQELLEQAKGIIPQTRFNRELIWPDGEIVDFNAVPAEVEREKLNRVVEEAFKEPGLKTMRNTHAVVVVYKDRIVAEKYADHVSATSPLLGWSMTKSLINALVGILVKDKKLNIKEPAPIKAWAGENDPRGKVTLDQLLRMSSGLEFDETPAPFSDATEMFYEHKSFADFAASKLLQVAPDSRWSYSSGTTNIIARIVRDAVGGTFADVYNFARQRLFDKVGMYSTLIEPDPSGSLVGSSYGFASARDWARFGLFIKNDGVWNGERILPQGWVDYSTSPTPRAQKGQYGAQFWLNAGARDNPNNKLFPSLPNDLFFMRGHNKQIVAVIPSRDVIVVRLGVTHDESWNSADFIKRVLDCVP